MGERSGSQPCGLLMAVDVYFYIFIYILEVYILNLPVIRASSVRRVFLQRTHTWRKRKKRFFSYCCCNTPEFVIIPRTSSVFFLFPLFFETAEGTIDTVVLLLLLLQGEHAYLIVPSVIGQWRATRKRGGDMAIGLNSWFSRRSRGQRRFDLASDKVRSFFFSRIPDQEGMGVSSPRWWHRWSASHEK